LLSIEPLERRDLNERDDHGLGSPFRPLGSGPPAPRPTARPRQRRLVDPPRASSYSTPSASSSGHGGEYLRLDRASSITASLANISNVAETAGLLANTNVSFQVL